MARINVADLDKLAAHRYRWARVLEVHSDWDTVDIELLNAQGQPTGEQWQDVPLFYHCSPDAPLRPNGALEGAAAAFEANCEVIVELDGFQEVKRVVARRDGLKACAEAAYALPVVTKLVCLGGGYRVEGVLFLYDSGLGEWVAPSSVQVEEMTVQAIGVGSGTLHFGGVDIPLGRSHTFSNEDIEAEWYFEGTYNTRCNLVHFQRWKDNPQGATISYYLPRVVSVDRKEDYDAACLPYGWPCCGILVEYCSDGSTYWRDSFQCGETTFLPTPYVDREEEWIDVEDLYLDPAWSGDEVDVQGTYRFWHKAEVLFPCDEYRSCDKECFTCRGGVWYRRTTPYGSDIELVELSYNGNTPPKTPPGCGFVGGYVPGDCPEGAIPCPRTEEGNHQVLQNEVYIGSVEPDSQYPGTTWDLPIYFSTADHPGYADLFAQFGWPHVLQHVDYEACYVAPL